MLVNQPRSSQFNLGQTEEMESNSRVRPGPRVCCGPLGIDRGTHAAATLSEAGQGTVSPRIRSSYDSLARIALQSSPSTSISAARLLEL